MKGKEYRWPDFLVIGAGKSGTTSINNYLKEHPQIFMSSYKEPNFFGYEPFIEEDFKSNRAELLHFRRSVTSKEQYLNLFTRSQDDQIIGEVSNTYLYHEHACNQIKKYVPKAKLIAIFRQPAERLYSRFLHLARDNQLPSEEFSECLQADGIWQKRSDLVPEGYYYLHLSKFYKEFPSSQIKVILFEDFQKEPQRIMKELFEFLGVDQHFSPHASLIYNESGYVKNGFLNRIYGRQGILKKLVPKNVYQYLKWNKHVQKALFKLRKANLHKPHLDLELKRQITAMYQEDIGLLSELIGRDLNHWVEFQKSE